MSFYEIIPIKLLEGKQQDAGRCSQNATVCGGNKDRVAPLYLHTPSKRHEKLITKCPEHRNWKNIHFFTLYFLCPFSFRSCILNLCPTKILGPKYPNPKKNFAIKSSSLCLPACLPFQLPTCPPARSLTDTIVSHQVSALFLSLLFLSRIR